LVSASGSRLATNSSSNQVEPTRSPITNNVFFKAHILFHLNDFETSLDASREMSSALTSDAWRVDYHLVRAANLAEIGRKEEAETEIAKSRALNPKLSLEFIKKLFGIANNHPDNRKAWLESLRKAGMPVE
jgi:tetratricopeptide (TPR) repeat protein